MFSARLLADLVVVFHACYVLFVAAGLVAILLGAWRGWRWVRNPWFRLLHLAAIGFVVLEEVFGWHCPLTVWENALRREGGQEVYAADFLGYWAHRLIFYDFPPSVFTVFYVVVGAIVGLTFVLVPPRRPGRSASPPG